MIEYLFKGKPDDFAVMVESLLKRRNIHGVDTPFGAGWFAHDSKIFALEFYRFQCNGKGTAIVTQEPSGNESRVVVYPVDENWTDYAYQDGWAILYSEAKRQLIQLADSGEEFQSESDTGAVQSESSGAANEQPISAAREELFIEDIDSFARARNVSPQEVRVLLPLELSEDQIQTYLEEIVGENFHQQDWGGEINDLMTSQVLVDGKRLRAAFMLKGNGTKGKLTISKCGKNGDQIVRLADAPVDLYVIQHVDEIDERVIYDLKGKMQLKNSKGGKCQMCIIDGTDTARILRAYGKI